AAPPTDAAHSNAAAGAAAKAPAPAAEVPESAVVLTIKGVCSPSVKAATASKTAAGKADTKKSAECETKITRAQFEKIATSLSPNVTPQLKHQLETVLPRFMAMSDAAKEKGLDNTPHFEEMMKIVRMQVLTQELQRSLQEQADKITPEEVDNYYKEHPEAYEQYSLDRLFIPRFKQVQPEAQPKDMTEEQRKAKDVENKAKQEQGEQELNKLADTLRAKAASGGDFAELQKQAFEAAGEKVENPTVNLPKVRRTGLPPAHSAVFDLKVGDVSQVISDNGGHYIYKVVSKEVVPLDQVKDEIHNKLKSERMKEFMDKYTNSFQAIPNEAYFGPPAGPGMMMPGGPSRPHPMAPRPGQGPAAAAPPEANAPSQPASGPQPKQE
ncbi:MAG: peptidyl-prolyl cis-trans isomerase, partial [Candidatus Sulfotelmatobacter sp.]